MALGLKESVEFPAVAVHCQAVRRGEGEGQKRMQSEAVLNLNRSMTLLPLLPLPLLNNPTGARRYVYKRT